METAEPVRRTLEIEDVTNLYFIHPVAARLVPIFAAMRVPPNAVSVIGMLFGALAGFSYYHYQDPRWVVAGFILMLGWHIMDGADGQLARLTKSQSRSGKVLDGICDYITFTAVYTGLALALSREHGRWVWGLVLVSSACHAVQSAAYEAQREDYNVWSRGFAVLKPIPSGAGAEPLTRSLQGLLHALYERVQRLTAGEGARFYQKFAARLQAQPENAELFRQRYRNIFAPAVRQWSVLSANYRTLGICICSLLKAPLLYFCLEIIGFSLILAVLLYWQRSRYGRFFNQLDAAAADWPLPVGAAKQVDRQHH